MKGSAIFAGIVLAWAATAAAEVAFSPPEGDFSAVFPKAPEVGGDTSTDPSQAVQDRTYLDDEGDHGFLVSVSQFRTGVVPAIPDVDFYRRALDLYTKGSGSDKLSSRPVSVGGQPAIEGTLKTPDGATMVVRLVARGSRVYTLAWTHPAAQISTEGGERFFNSFRFVGQ
jgi:hypothetical protein